MSTVAPVQPPSGPAGPGVQRAPTPAFTLDTARLEALAASLAGRLRVDAYGPHWEPEAESPAPLAANLAAGAAVPLLDLGLLSAEGPEALSFLHAQLTQDTEKLPLGEARWYGYCNPKGRLQASFLGWRSDPQAQADPEAAPAPASPIMRLALSAGLAEPLRRRLGMFILRAKLKLLDRSAEHTAFGLVGAAAQAWLVRRLGAAPLPFQVLNADGLSLIGLPPVPCNAQGSAELLVSSPGPSSLPRWLVWAPQAQAGDVWRQLRADSATGGAGLAPMAAEHWRWLEILCGVPRILPGTWEHFVPQMINFELIGGVNFRKGCYPGQEVVARSQYLGKLKRRMSLGWVRHGLPEPGADIIPASGGEACGEVVMAARGPDARVAVLFESQTAALASPLTVAGEPIELAALPYPIPAPT